MSSQVNIKFAQREISIVVHADQAMAQDAARDWLDAQFIALDGEPLRPSGKLLRADKVLVVAREAGLTRFDDPVWAHSFAAAAVALLERPLLRLDTLGMTVSY